MAAPSGRHVIRTGIKTFNFTSSTNNSLRLCRLIWEKTAKQLHTTLMRQTCRGQTFASLLWPSVFVVNAISFGRKTVAKEVELSKMKPGQVVVEEADRLYALHEVDALYKYLSQHAALQDDEVQWRLARAACDKAKTEHDNKTKERLFREALQHAERALALNPNNFASHKWYAIMLNYLSPFWGIRESLKHAYTIKNHLEKAIELNPKDATSIHSLGYWCFVFADLKWYERKVAALLHSTPPDSTYSEALKYFLQAENVDPQFYSMNLTMIGKTYMRLSNYKMAMVYLTRARDYPVVTEDDRMAHDEAVVLLRQAKHEATK